MTDLPVIVVFKSRGRDIAPLAQAVGKDFSIHVVEECDDFIRLIKKHIVSCIIVPLGSKEEGSQNARKFADIASLYLQPEDADLTIIYSTEFLTPDDWSGTLDPRPVRDLSEPQLVMDDRDWRYTIPALRKAKDREAYRRPAVNHIVEIELADFREVPFTSEAHSILRAAFKDMAKISISFPKQGLSGSIAVVITPTGYAGEPCRRRFVKIYPDQEKASEEQGNTRYIKPYIDPVYYPEYDDLRRYRGMAYSLVVTNLVEGPSGEAQTLKDMVLSGEYSLKQMNEYIGDLLTILRRLPRLKPPMPLKFMETYLSKYLADPHKDRIISSYNAYHKWFGNYADGLSLADKISGSLPSVALNGTVYGACHGDFHSENIMLRVVGGKIIPFLIDFSRCGGSHSIKDLITLEIDMIIRGLSGIKLFSLKDNIVQYLRSINAGAFNMEVLTDAERLQVEKVSMVIKTLREFSLADHGVMEMEYCGAALFKTLEILSYGKLPYDQNERATTYVDYLIERIKLLTK